jgi:hypothetical protein
MSKPTWFRTSCAELGRFVVFGDRFNRIAASQGCDTARARSNERETQMIAVGATLTTHQGMPERRHVMSSRRQQNEKRYALKLHCRHTDLSQHVIGVCSCFSVETAGIEAKPMAFSQWNACQLPNGS